MNAPDPVTTASPMLMSSADFRESLRSYRPTVYVDGRLIDSVADAPSLQPGINALGVTYDYALKPELAPLMTAAQTATGRTVNRMLHVDESAGDLLNKLEAVRILCQETGCAQRYLAHDGLAAIGQVSARIDDARGSTEHRARFHEYLDHVQAERPDARDRDDRRKGRSLEAPARAGECRHVRACRRAQREGDRAVGHQGDRYRGALRPRIPRDALPQHGPRGCRLRSLLRAAGRCAGTHDRRAAGGASRREARARLGAVLAALRTIDGVVIFDKVFVPWERVFYAGEWEHSGTLTYNYATHHRQTCIGARAGFGDLLIGAGALMCEANGFDIDEKSNLKEPMVELIKIVEGFYACGVAASVYGTRDALSGIFMPEPVFANIGKLLLATQIYDMHRLAHEVSGGLIVALPGPDEDHNPATAATLAEVLRANPSVPYDKRIEVARFIEDLTASYQAGWYSLISLHGGGSPAAMKQEIWRNYPVGNKVELVERLLERGVLHDESRKITRNRQPGRCCDTGCTQPGQPVMVPLPAGKNGTG
jgi:4-hydroxybutyryl-CoA dehydratase/vinylacetyl-CoA-Delta-isomerase